MGWEPAKDNQTAHPQKGDDDETYQKVLLEK
jgi:hypothetical protein